MEDKLKKLWSDLDDRLLNFIKKKMRSKEDAEDALQEVYITIHEKIGTLEDEEKFTSWVFQIARNKINNCYRKCYTKTSTEFKNELGGSVEEEGEENFNEEIILSMKEFIDKLPPKYKEIITLYELEGKSHKEIAQILDINENTSKTRLKRGKVKLKELLDQCCTFQIDNFGNVLEYNRK